MFILSTIYAVGLVLFGVVQAAATAVTEVQLGPVLVTTLLAVIIPIIVGFATKAGASAPVKQVLTIVLAGFAGFLNEALVADGSAVFTLEALYLAGLTWVQAIAIYLGVYAPLNLNEHTKPDSGLGSVNTAPVESIQ